ncbi:AzlD domain-containing protein [Affinibrenneria salicis]|uniref:AzlD domain-containing protein n=1 Tax=Affinibrenneria salicis TaxID=2590031 RepID=A0A5J5FXS4_9GAMM|nr:AzlD domain-containing protein [Affinibrenneria salicis]KAA8998605.1 AzlD domain-containing protein [Affinibrenneria salicis]
MMPSLLITILACALVTLVIRALPIVFLAGIRLPGFVYAWLSFVPSGIMVALVALELVKLSVRDGGALAPISSAALAALAAIMTKSLFTTALVGVGGYLLWFVFT